MQATYLIEFHFYLVKIISQNNAPFLIIADTLKWIFSNIPFMGPSSCAAVWTERNTMYENMKKLDKRALSKINFLRFKRNKRASEFKIKIIINLS